MGVDGWWIDGLMDDGAEAEMFRSPERGEFRDVGSQDIIEPRADELAALVPSVLGKGFEGGLVHAGGRRKKV
jgi:hypothetical protein